MNETLLLEYMNDLIEYLKGEEDYAVRLDLKERADDMRVDIEDYVRVREERRSTEWSL